MTSVFRPHSGHLAPDERPLREVAPKVEPAPTFAHHGAVPDARVHGWQATGSATNVETPKALQAALATTFGEAIARSVMSELGLAQISQRPLTATEVNAAVTACATSVSALSGLNFISQALLSARADSPQFRDCAAALGVDAQSWSNETRSAIDLAFAREMALAGSAGRRCVDMRDAQLLMQRAIAMVVPGAGKHESGDL